MLDSLLKYFGAKPYIGCPYSCPCLCPLMPMGFGWAWVGMAAIILFMGGHGWAWAKAKAAKHIGRGHWMNSHSMLSRVRASNHLHLIRRVHPSMCLLFVLLLLLLKCVPGLPRILGLFFVTFLCLCFPTLPSTQSCQEDFKTQENSLHPTPNRSQTSRMQGIR